MQQILPKQPSTVKSRLLVVGGSQNRNVWKQTTRGDRSHILSGYASAVAEMPSFEADSGGGLF
jgi:hypothetical protein